MNSVVGSVVVAFDPEGVDLDDLVEVVEGVEDAHGMHEERFPADRPDHPGDIEPLRRNLIAAGADVLGLGVSVFGRILQATPIPTEVASVVSLVEHQPRVRKILENHIGAAATDLGLGVTSAFAQALTQGPLGLVVSLGHRASVAAEVATRRHAWGRREPELAGSRHDVPLGALEFDPRPTPLPQGPVERYADRAGLASIGGFGVSLLVTQNPRRAASVLIAGIPRASSMGREVFAAHLGRELASRDILVLDRAVLRRLDRIDTIVLDATVITTDRLVVAEVESFGEIEIHALRTHAALALEMEQVGGPHQVDGWRLSTLEAVRPMLPRGALSKARLLGRGGAVRAVVHDCDVVGLAVIVPELDPLAESLAASALGGGHHLVVAGERGAVGVQLGTDASIPGGRHLVPGIRALQMEGRSVLLLSGGAEHQALRASDCGIGITGSAPHPPWGAHLLTSHGLEDAWFVIEATRTARDVSRRSALLAVAGSTVGGAWALMGPSMGSGRRAALPVNTAALVAEASGMASAVTLGRRRAPALVAEVSWHSMDGDAVLRALNSSPEGLDDVEAGARRPPVPVVAPFPMRVAGAVVSELANPLTPVLAIGAGVAGVVGSTSDALLVGGTVLANGIVSGVQRVRTELSIKRLYQASESLVTARRDGHSVELRSAELVPGDVVELEAGDVVPADCRILEALDCEVDESVLTGESLPTRKHTKSTPGAELAERACMLSEGTTLVAGSALAVVVAVGAATEVGRALAGAQDPPPSGVEARLAAFTRVVLPITFASGAAVTGIGLLRGRSLREVVGTG
ncbi:MAG: hypothetical protein ACLQPH_11490, partial [Acidimicrobiales bacterium]